MRRQPLHDYRHEAGAGIDLGVHRASIIYSAARARRVVVLFVEGGSCHLKCRNSDVSELPPVLGFRVPAASCPRSPYISAAVRSREIGAYELFERSTVRACASCVGPRARQPPARPLAASARGQNASPVMCLHWAAGCCGCATSFREIGQCLQAAVPFGQDSGVGSHVPRLSGCILLFSWSCREALLS